MQGRIVIESAGRDRGSMAVIRLPLVYTPGSRPGLALPALDQLPPHG